QSRPSARGSACGARRGAHGARPGRPAARRGGVRSRAAGGRTPRLTSFFSFDIFRRPPWTHRMRRRNVRPFAVAREATDAPRMTSFDIPVATLCPVFANVSGIPRTSFPAIEIQSLKTPRSSAFFHLVSPWHGECTFHEREVSPMTQGHGYEEHLTCGICV